MGKGPLIMTKTTNYYHLTAVFVGSAVHFGLFQLIVLVLWSTLLLFVFTLTSLRCKENALMKRL